MQNSILQLSGENSIQSKEWELQARLAPTSATASSVNNDLHHLRTPPAKELQLEMLAATLTLWFLPHIYLSLLFLCPIHTYVQN